MQLTNKSRIFGSIILLSGSVIGGGMIPLPLEAGINGFIPAIFILLLGFVYLLLSAFMLLQVNLHFPAGSNIPTMANATLGRYGKWFAKILLLLILYALLASYIAGAGSIVHAVLTTMHVPKTISIQGNIIFTVIFAGILYWGIAFTDNVNRILAFGLIVSIVVLMSLMLPHMELNKLKQIHLNESWWMALPIVVIAFTFQPLIPAIREYLNSDYRKLKYVLIIGALIPLILFLLWQTLLSSTLDLAKFSVILNSVNPVTRLTSTISQQTQIVHITKIADIFSFCAITTSFIGVAVSLQHVLADIFVKKKSSPLRSVALMLIPPLLFTEFYPKVYLFALDYAGLMVVILFGILPAIMAWRLRKDSVDGLKLSLSKQWLPIATLIVASVIVLLLFIL